MANEPKQKNENEFWKKLFILILIALAAATFLKPAIDEAANPTSEVTYSEFSTMVSGGLIKTANINSADSSVDAVTKTDQRVKSYIVLHQDLLETMEQKGVNINVVSPNQNWLGSLIGSILVPFLLFAGLWFFIFKQAQGANNQAMSFGKSKAKEWSKDGKVKTTFEHIAGADEAVEELKEIVEFLREPKKFIDIGAKIPKGVLLMGPPGCGKTLLARAVAGESSVKFFHISGSDFVEMFVGVGASRVRDLFAQAKKQQPAIVFVDEIDAVGRHRGAGLGGGHDEREQTLNQLLVEMDGFDDKSAVIVIAATNRPDVLDPALLRPGRFDRQVVIDRPDVKGRKEIIDIHIKKVKVEKEIDTEIVAKRTPGFTGADLANLVNEAALLAARNNKKKVSMQSVEAAIDRLIAGPEKKSKVMSPKEKEIIAYHELGHALVAKKTPGADPVHKISILPRGMALGYTLQLPLEDKYLVSRNEMLDQITILLGGRVAEELNFKEITTGASNDIERATKIAHDMVCRYGMSKLGTRSYGKSDQNVFLGKEVTQHDRDYGDSVANSIDIEINAIIESAYQKATKILTTNKSIMKKMAKELMEKEVLSGEDLARFFPE